jgi:hypothetical protein
MISKVTELADAVEVTGPMPAAKTTAKKDLEKRFIPQRKRIEPERAAGPFFPKIAYYGELRLLIPTAKTRFNDDCL